MLSKIAKHNADILWNHPNHDANFDIDSTGQLFVISQWNLIERFIKWIRNWNGGVTAKINQCVKDTLEQIAAENAIGRPHVYVHDHGTDFMDFIFDARRAYSPHYPADQLAFRILTHPQFKNIHDIDAAAQKVMNQQSGYPRSRNPHAQLDPRVMEWDEIRA